MSAPINHDMNDFYLSGIPARLLVSVSTLQIQLFCCTLLARPASTKSLTPHAFCSGTGSSNPPCCSIIFIRGCIGINQDVSRATTRLWHNSHLCCRSQFYETSAICERQGTTAWLLASVEISLIIIHCEGRVHRGLRLYLRLQHRLDALFHAKQLLKVLYAQLI